MDVVKIKDLINWADGVLSFNLKYGNYVFIAMDGLYFNAYLNSLKNAAFTTVLCLFIGYPFAYFMSRARSDIQSILLMVVMLPFWTSFLLRVYAWKGLLTEGGLVFLFLDATGLNHLLFFAGLISDPNHLIYTHFSLLIGMVYTYLPFMILPLYTNLSKLDNRLLEASSDLGATPWVTFWRVTVPLSKSGILAGAMLVFIPCVGEYVIPEMLGGSSTLMIGRVLWDEFFSNNDWPLAASLAVVMVLLISIPLAVFNRAQDAAEERRP